MRLTDDQIHPTRRCRQNHEDTSLHFAAVIEYGLERNSFLIKVEIEESNYRRNEVRNEELECSDSKT